MNLNAGGGDFPAGAAAQSRPGRRLIEAFHRGWQACIPDACLEPHWPEAPPGRLAVIAVGKAADPMARAAIHHYGERAEGLLIAPAGQTADPLPVGWIFQPGNHPAPGPGSLAAGQAALDLAESLKADDLLLLLLSGGASSLMALPHPDITLAEQAELIERLMSAGATIHEINAVRGAISRIKAGRLAAASAAPTVTLAASDVPGNDPCVIGSGPSWAAGAALPDALGILARYRIMVSSAVRERIGAGVAEARGLKRVGRYTVVVAGAQMLEAAAESLAPSYAVLNLGDGLEDDAHALARRHAAFIRQRHRAGERVALLSGGETTVSIGERRGRGGRNTEYLLALALALDGLPGCWALACDSDGIDGTGGHAGAVIGPDTLARGRAAGLSARHHLANHDSAGYFDRLKDLIVTGPTGTNVNDFRALVLEP